MYSKRKTQYFEIDALIAIALLIAGLIYVKSLSVGQVKSEQNEEYSRECIKLLTTLKVNDLDPDTRNMLANSLLGRYTHDNFTLAKQIAIYLIEGNRSLAENVTRIVLDSLIPFDYGYGIWIRDKSNESVIYNRSLPREEQDIAIARTMITGLQQDKPIIGKLARLYLSRSMNRLKEYMFFGGFVGQGDISFKIELPPGADVTDVYFEGFIGEDVNVSVNDSYCDNINKTGKIEDITQKSLNCIELFKEGMNKVIFSFQSPEISNQYIGGGFFEVVYSVEEIPIKADNKTRKKLPGIKGLINIYDSLFFDGNVSDFKIELSFNKTVMGDLVFVLGNETLFSISENGEYDITLNQSNISSDVLEKENVPFRFGYPAIVAAADIVWITDRSESMWTAQDLVNVWQEEKYFGYYQEIPEFAFYYSAPLYFSARGWSTFPGWGNWDSVAYSSGSELCINLSDNSGISDAYFNFSLGGNLENYTIRLDYNFIECPRAAACPGPGNGVRRNPRRRLR